MSLQSIEQLAKVHAGHRSTLGERVKALQDEIEADKRRRMPGIRAAVVMFRASHQELAAAVDAERGLFVKPKTTVFHGIKVGLRKAKGKLTYANLQNVVKLIKKHFTADQVELLVKTTEKPIKAGIMALKGDELKKIGCTIEGTGDEVVVESVDDEIEKAVNALLPRRTKTPRTRTPHERRAAPGGALQLTGVRRYAHLVGLRRGHTGRQPRAALMSPHLPRKSPSRPLMRRWRGCVTLNAA